MSGRERVSAADAAWLHMDRPTNLMVINVVLWFDAPLDWTVLAERIESRWIDQYPRFRQRVVEGWLRLLGPNWEDDPRFALENHLHRLALPAPGDQDALQDFVGDRMGVPLDRTKPLWQVYLVEGYGSGCAVVIRVHHSLADGIALAKEHLAKYKYPRRIEFVDSLPLGPSGKVLKRELVEQFRDQCARRPRCDCPRHRRQQGPNEHQEDSHL
jgi:hypothetical protein